MLPKLNVVSSPPNYKKWIAMMGDEDEVNNDMKNENEKNNVDVDENKEKDENLPSLSLPKNILNKY